MKYDICRVLLLISIYGLFIYSALNKFYFSEESGTNIIKIKPDFSPCYTQFNLKNKSCSNQECIQHVNEGLNSCKNLMKKGSDEINNKCKGYFEKLKDCQSQGKRNCQVEKSNANNCAHLISSAYIEMLSQEQWMLLL